MRKVSKCCGAATFPERGADICQTCRVGCQLVVVPAALVATPVTPTPDHVPGYPYGDPNYPPCWTYSISVSYEELT